MFKESNSNKVCIFVISTRCIFGWFTRKSHKRKPTAREMNQDFKAYLNSVPVSTLVVKTVIDAEETEPISFVFQRLLRNRILSLPVYSARNGVKHYCKYYPLSILTPTVGFVDIMDVLYSFLQNKSGAHHKITAGCIDYACC